MPGIAGGSLFIGKPLIVFYGNRFVPDSGAYDNSSDYFRNDLTVTSVLKDSSNVAVSGSTVTLSNVPSTDGTRQGVYEGTQAGTISLTANATYYLEITVSASAVTLDFVRITYKAVYDDGKD